jgi:hypothetical protein
MFLTLEIEPDEVLRQVESVVVQEHFLHQDCQLGGSPSLGMLLYLGQSFQAFPRKA